jgi:hypothetical protein
MTELHTRLLQILPIGKASARTADDLARQLQSEGLLEHNTKDGKRIIRQLIHDLRCAGVPVCSFDEGNYLPATLEELQDYIRRSTSRVMELLTPHNKVKHTFQRLQAITAGQTSADPTPWAHIPEPYQTILTKRLRLPLPPTRPLTTKASTLPNITSLIDALFTTLPIQPHYTLELATAKLYSKLITTLREHIPIPQTYLNQHGWNRATIANYIKDRFYSRLHQIRQQTQNSLFGGDEP